MTKKPTLFVRSFGFLQGASLRPSEVVRVVRRAMDDWLTTPPGSKRTTKTLLFSGEPANPSTLIWRNEPNFNTSNIIVTSYITVGYNDFFQNSTKKTNPIKANFRQVASKPWRRRRNTGITGLFREILAFLKTLFMESKPNFKTLRPILTPEKKGTYNNLCPQKHKKSKPNPNPIQTQFFHYPQTPF